MAAPLWQFSGSETGNASQWFPQDAQPWLDDLLEREDMVPVLVHPLEVVPNAALKLVCDVGVAGVRAKQEHCGRFQRRNTYMHAIHCFLKTQNASLTSSFTKPSASRHINTEEDQWLLLEPGIVRRARLAAIKRALPVRSACVGVIVEPHMVESPAALRTW